MSLRVVTLHCRGPAGGSGLGRLQGALQLLGLGSHCLGLGQAFRSHVCHPCPGTCGRSEACAWVSLQLLPVCLALVPRVHRGP